LPAVGQSEIAQYVSGLCPVVGLERLLVLRKELAKGSLLRQLIVHGAL